MSELSQDNRQKRGDVTRQAMMRAAEELIAEHGIENVSIRDIVQAAGQKNESALQYHFGSLNGLFNAVVATRNEQTQVKRQEQLDALLADNPDPQLRDICKLMVTPAFELGRAHPDFRHYIVAFGNTLAAADEPFKTASLNAGGSESGQRLGDLLRLALPHLSEQEFRQRMDFAVRLCSSSMHHHARQSNAFKGKAARHFLESLVDAVMGLLSGPVSDEAK